MMVVEKETDLENIRKAGVFDGRYFVLGGLLPITTKRSVQTFSGDALLSEVNRAKQSDALSEIILGLPVSAEGDHTADYLRNALSKDTSLMVTILGRGLSTGADLEYSDDKTLKSALQNRC
jgi:recombination protein RecR